MGGKLKEQNTPNKTGMVIRSIIVSQLVEWKNGPFDRVELAAVSPGVKT